MEARRETLSSIKLCRFCLGQGDTLTSIYEKQLRASKNTVNLPLKILSCISTEVFPSDKMPTYICNRCKFFMDLSYDFKHLCRQADEHILQFVQNGTPLTAISYPQSLLRLFRMYNKTPEVPLMKTVIEGGATVQVTAHESDTDEEDDENVYNVKVGDGSDDGAKSARIKVITGVDKQEKGKRGKECVGTQSVDNWISELAREGWACEKCKYWYPVQKQLNQHTKQRHTVEKQITTQCTNHHPTLNTGNEMLKRQIKDHKNISFECIVCHRKFKHQRWLKKHEKCVHADLVHYPCEYCPTTFLALEQLTTHERKHTTAVKYHICELCKKRFLDESSLREHVEATHYRNPPHCCRYCSQRYATAAKLTRHVRTHAEERSYPCKYCNKSFVKSHHYTRHLRIKHRENIRTCRGPFGETDQYRCEQCEDSFATQDELIYHSAIHATQNLICPLCQEKFEDVDAVTSHIKSHVNGTEFMCDLCELVFTTREKLDIHITVAHDDEIRNAPDHLQDESSTEMDVDEDEEDTGINVKELDDHMVVEIKKPSEFLLPTTQEESEEKLDNTNSEESESEMTLPDLGPVETMPNASKESIKPTTEGVSIATIGGATITKTSALPPKIIDTNFESQTASILRKAEEIKKKVIQPAAEAIAEKKNNNKPDNGNTVGASDKSLRLLEKELQELKRTNTRSEAAKTPVKPLEIARTRRVIHTSTPKVRTPVEEKKPQVAAKSPAPEKKLPERRVVTKENKEPKDNKETKANNVSAKEDKDKEVKEKEVKEKEVKDKEVKEKETKEKETPKSVVKNGSEKSTPEEGIRRSTRPSKIKDYAKMIRDRSQDSDENDESDDTDEEYKEADKSVESRPRGRRASLKTPAPKSVTAAAAATPTVPRKRGRPRKDAGAVAPKIRKEEAEDEDEASDSEKDKSKTAGTSAAEKEGDSKPSSENSENSKSAEQKPPSSTLVSPTGQTLKKIPIRALPPGVKPLPLPVNARPMAGGEVSEMQIGQRMVKVQKIVMTKAEVEAMTKKGLLEVKDGTMILKQGIKLPSTDASALKSLVAEDAGKESPSKKSAPTRCDLGEEV